MIQGNGGHLKRDTNTGSEANCFIRSENLYTLELYPCLARFIFIFFTQKDIRRLEEGRK